MAMSRGGSTVKTIIVLVILVLVGVLGVLGVNTVKTYTSGASSGYDPKNVLAKPLTKTVGGSEISYAVITWTTDLPSQGSVQYGTSPANLLLTVPEVASSTEHSVEIPSLKKNTSYYFKIMISGTEYMNGEIPFSFKTKASTEGTVPNVVLTPTTALIPTVVTQSSSSTPSGSSSNPAGGCSRTVDYNKDGAINSIDFIYCMSNHLGIPATSTPSAATGSASACSRTVDYNGDGTINSLDYIKCLQMKK